MALGELRGPMADETVSWLNRVALGLPTPAATVEEAHNNLMLTKALDLSAKRKQPVKLPLDPGRGETRGLGYNVRKQPTDRPKPAVQSRRNGICDDCCWRCHLLFAALPASGAGRAPPSTRARPCG